MHDIGITSSCSEGQLISLPIKGWFWVLSLSNCGAFFGLVTLFLSSRIPYCATKGDPPCPKNAAILSVFGSSPTGSQDYGHLSACQMCAVFVYGWIGWDFDCCNTASKDLWYQLPGSLAPGPPGRDERNITKGSPWEQRNSSWYQLPGSLAPGPPGRDERNITKGSPWEQRNSSWYQLPGSLAPGPPGRDERNITKRSPWEQRNSSRLWYILFGQCQLGDSLPKHLRDLRIKEEPLRALCTVFQRHDFSGGLLRCWWSLLVCSTEDEPDTQRSFWNSVHTIWLGLFTLQVGTAVGCAEFGCFVHLCGWQVQVPNLWALWLPWKLGVLWRAQDQGSMPQCGRCHRQDPAIHAPISRRNKRCPNCCGMDFGIPGRIFSLSQGGGD